MHDDGVAVERNAVLRVKVQPRRDERMTLVRAADDCGTLDAIDRDVDPAGGDDQEQEKADERKGEGRGRVRPAVRT
jgi:hypothetical protein